MTIGAPPQNYSIPGNRQRIAPSWHVGPRMYSDAGVILHPMQSIQAFVHPFSPVPGFSGAFQNAAHPFTINGKQPR